MKQPQPEERAQLAEDIVKRNALRYAAKYAL